MKSPPVDESGEEKGVRQNKIITLADGTRVTEHNLSVTETLPDGTVVSKSRTSRTYASQGPHDTLKKSITTSITRTDAITGVRTITTTEEIITAAKDVEAEPNSTETQKLPDGSSVITTKTSNVLSDGSLSAVVTKVHMNKKSSLRNVHDDNGPTFGPSPPRPVLLPAQDSPRVDVLHSNHQDDYDARIKRKEAQNRQTAPGIEMIDANDGAAVPPASSPGVEMVVGPDIRGKAERTKQLGGSTASRLETIDNGTEEPIPMNFHSADPDRSYVGAALISNDNKPPYLDKDDMKLNANRTISALETLNDGSEEEPIPLSFHTATIAEHSKILDLESGPSNTTAANRDPSSIDAHLKPEKNEKSGRFTFGSKPWSERFSGDYVAGSNINLAVATPVMGDDAEKPIYEATSYEAKTPIYKTWKCIAITLVLLAVIGVVVGVAVTSIVQPEETPVLIEYVTASPTAKPTVAPTSERDIILAQTIERSVLMRNASFDNMTSNNPRKEALNWTKHTDSMQLEPTDPNLSQRYTLALLAFQLDHAVWFNEPDVNATSNETLDATDDSSEEIIDWLSPTDECDWFGVTCVDGVVTEIDLSSNQLIGVIPPEIGNLESLEKLVLSDNCLYGTMASELGLLTNLLHIDISSNGLHGLLPDEFFNLAQLSFLDLSWQSNNYNNCTASDGTIVQPLYKMGDEGLRWNYGLEGSFFLNIGRLSNLVHIMIDQNSFTGPISADIKRLQQLSYLSGGGNWFNGTLPDAIGMLAQLKEFWMSTNTFSGPLPQNIGDASKLEVIYLWVNEDGNMNGSLPDSFYNLQNLKQLSLSGHSFTGHIKTEIGNMRSLTSFKISRNSFSGTLPSELGLCEKLEWIQIHASNITGSASEEVCALRSKNLNPAYIGQPVFQADCTPEGGVPFFECGYDCCTTCCAHSTQVCSSNT